MNNLKTFRKINGLTQEELGQYLNVKKAFISRIENGHAMLPAEKLERLMANDKDWVVDCLKNSAPTTTINYNNTIRQDTHTNTSINSSAQEIAVLKERITHLEAALQREKDHNKDLTEMYHSVLRILKGAIGGNNSNPIP